MPNYRRVFIPGGTWFFTVNLLERRSKLLTENATSLRHAIFCTKRRLPFRIDALVILPDHLHAVVTLPPDDSNFPQRLRHIKSRFSKSLPKTEWLSGVRTKRGERGIWQRRYWEITFAMNVISAITSLIAITIPSNTTLFKIFAIGRIQLFTATFAPDGLSQIF